MAKKKETEEKEEEKKDTEEKKSKKTTKKKTTKKETTKKKKTEKKEEKTEKKEKKEKKEEKKESKKGSAKDDIIEAIKTLSVIELYELVKELEEEFDVSAQPTAVSVAPGATAGEEVAEKEEKKTFDAILASVGDQKLQVIKVVRQLTKLGLKEAKSLVDSAPSPIKEEVSKEEADEIKTKLEEVGAKVELK
jgi:large subunit ribosomal protein L7/L12